VARLGGGAAEGDAGGSAVARVWSSPASPATGATRAAAVTQNFLTTNDAKLKIWSSAFYVNIPSFRFVNMKMKSYDGLGIQR
jgi:hypothetical protein